jgi:uncharacterized protein
MKAATTFQNMLALAVVALAILFLVPLDPDVKVGDFQATTYTGKINPSPDYIVQDHYFPAAHNVACHAWLYLPLNATTTTTANNDRTLPVIIMASGFAEQKDFGLDVYAERFVAHGFAVFLFDYRTFGASQGNPRNLVSPKRHVQDWHAAIDYIISSSKNPASSVVDSSRIGLWGMSFAGGHVLTVASQRQDDSRIVGVVAQAPFLKTAASTRKSSKKRGNLGKLRLVVAALQDTARGYLGLAPLVIPILGVHSQLAMMPSAPHRMEQYFSRQPAQKLGGWINQGPVRGLFELRSYSPLETVRKKPPQIPVLLVSGSRDDVCPAGVIEEVRDLMPRSRVITRNASHLEIMGPDHAPEVGLVMANFFSECFL